MNINEKTEFGIIIAALADSFGVECKQSLLTGYWMGLEDLEIEQVRAAAARSIRELRFFPKPIDLREMCGVMQPTERAIVAWQAVKDAIAKQGAYRSVDFDDKLINAAIRNLGGWVEICQKSTEEFEKWTRKDFERIYSSLLRSGTTKQACEYLVGIAEKNNFGHGHDFEKPVQVKTGLPPYEGFRLIDGGKSGNQDIVNLLTESLSKMEIK